MSAKTEFLASLAKSSEVVTSWPSWKQTVWDARTSSTSQTKEDQRPAFQTAGESLKFSGNGN
jgi:hypothetical protein